MAAVTKDADLSHYEWYHGLMLREELPELLKKNGDYLVRMTEPLPDEPPKYVLSVMKQEMLGKDGIKHLILLQNPEGNYIGGSLTFPSIPKLIHHYHGKELTLTEELSLPLKKKVGRQRWELEYDDLSLLKKIGEGAYGEVYIGEWRRSKGHAKKVAIKVAKISKLTKDQTADLMIEARLMRHFDHENVVTFFGICALKEPLMVVMEFLPNGSLQSYLKKSIQPTDVKTDMVYQAALGVEYIHDQKVIHRDIACRNCLYGDDLVKIADFGMSRQGTSYQMEPHKKIPLRWMSPEVITTGMYSQKTDMWSFGILVWEIYSNGAEPYPNYKKDQIAGAIRDQYRHDFPPDVNPELAKIIKEKCWSQNPNGRSYMSELVKLLQRFIHPTESPGKRKRRPEKRGSDKKYSDTISDTPKSDPVEMKALSPVMHFKKAHKRKGHSIRRRK